MKESTSQLWQLCRKAASRLTLNPFGSQASHFPYRRRHGGTGEDIATFPAIQIEQALCIALNLDLIFG